MIALIDHDVDPKRDQQKPLIWSAMTECLGAKRFEPHFKITGSGQARWCNQSGGLNIRHLFWHEKNTEIGLGLILMVCCMHLEVSTNGVPQNRCFFFVENTTYKWIMTRGTPMTLETSNSFDA